ncbi:MAG: COX15/CtaA family protein [Pseudomonadota bacterium]|nr:COX15/CtaA family protein [Pseudomonadota bacterium]
MKKHTSITIKYVHLTTIILAIIVVTLGAYTRLTNAGLGCPDWPKCFQNWIVKPEITSPALSQEASLKAWIEMIHRYAAGLLCIMLIQLKILKSQNFKHTIINSILVIALLQALFGMWTVTWKLHPLAVMPHLIGGMTITSLLCIDYVESLSPHPKTTIPKSTQKIFSILLMALIMQVILGGWTSANYAALVCPDFPTCQGQWLTSFTSFIQGFSPPIGHNTYEGGVLSGQARIAIHMAHRIGACICTILILALTWNIIKNRKSISLCTLKQFQYLVTLFLFQITLGILNILWQLPLTIALGHNIIALALIIQCSVILVSSTSHTHENILDSTNQNTHPTSTDYAKVFT